ncbi:MAG: hypothetical protein ABWJ42_01780 [Sulfolobales archaeon]
MDSFRGEIVVLGNSKMGKVLHINLPRGAPRGVGFNAFLNGTCPGASEWCLKNCYGIDKPPSEDLYSIEAMYRAVKLSLYSPREFVKRVVFEIERYSEILSREEESKEILLRLHVVGDFYHPLYVDLWLEIMDLLGERVRAWSYTRSWWIDKVEERYREIMIPRPREAAEELFYKLNELRKKKNFTLYASTDSTMPDITKIPELRGWLEAGIEFTYSRNANVCPEIPCVACKYCAYGRGNVIFIERRKIRSVGKPWDKAFSEREWREYVTRERDRVAQFLSKIKSLKS